MSRFVSEASRGNRPSLVCDFLPDVSEEELHSQLAVAALDAGRRQIAHLLADRLPHRLVETLVEQAGLERTLGRAWA